MADVTVAELAKMVGVPVERLLEQIKDAELPQAAADDTITNDERARLLASLKRRHGDDSGTESSPRRITLKRKTVGTLKSADSQGRGTKAVNVEVRKKRTYVKRSVEEAQKEAAEREAQLAEERRLEEEARKAREEEERKAREAEEAARAAEEAARQSKVAESQPAASAATPAAAVAPEPAPEGKSESRRKAATFKKEAPDRKKGDEEKDKPRSSLRKKGGKKFRGKSSDEFILDADGDVFQGGGRRRRRKLSHGMEHKFEKPTEFIAREIEVPEAITVANLAQRMSVKSGQVIKALMSMGVMATINQILDQDTSVLVVEELGHKAKLISDDAIEESLTESIRYEGEGSVRPPVVTVMGHVDHGKTSLLDHIRKSTVAEGEAGGITQHIGAYHVDTGHGIVSFLDTPGHAAFSAMRSRGAKATDIVILVVAADDGVKPQTEEAVDHAQAAGVPIVVAINKIDKEGADPDRIKSELASKGLTPEEWGGETQFIEVSALKGTGIEALLEAVLLQSEIMELKAVFDGPATGVVIESRLDRGRGPVATVLVQNGTLQQGDMILAGHEYGRVRALIDENGKQVKSAGPSIPVEVLGLNSTPDAGDEFLVVKDERQAKEVSEFRREKTRTAHLARQQAAKMESMFATMGKDDIRVLNLVIKTDVRGSLEAILASLHALSTDEVAVNIVSSGVGGISETDAQLAATSSATLVGFNVRADKSAREIVEVEGLELRYYSVIYSLIDDVKAVLSGMLAPEIQEEILGVAEVRDIFNSPKFGSIAGCMVIEGTVYRSKPIRVLRDDVVIYEGELESLRRFKDEASEVRHGMECGIGVKNYNDVRAGDKIEVYNRKEVARSL